MESIGLLMVAAILPFIAIIVFFIMADKVGKIHKELIAIRKRISPDWLDHDFLAQREEFKGNKDSALEHYQNLLFELESGLKNKLMYVKWTDRMKYTKERIKSLGGESP